MNDSFTNDPSANGSRVGRRAGLRRTVLALGVAGAVGLGTAAVAHGGGWGGGWGGGRGGGGDRAERAVERVGERLELDDAQSDALRALVDEASGLGRALRGDGPREELAALVAGPTLDQAAALALLEARSDALRAAAPGLVAAAAAFHDGLDEAQRAEALELLERAGGRRGRGGDR